MESTSKGNQKSIKLKEKSANLYFFVYYKHVLYVMSLIFINFARIYKTVITV